jgi:hypothetical protein
MATEPDEEARGAAAVIWAMGGIGFSSAPSRSAALRGADDAPAPR